MTRDDRLGATAPAVRAVRAQGVLVPPQDAAQGAGAGRVRRGHRCSATGIDPQVRPEVLTPEQFLAMFELAGDGKPSPGEG